MANIAPIAPMQFLDYQRNWDYQLMLPQLEGQYPEYREYWKSLEDNGHYVILDNGANEHMKANFERLLLLAKTYPVDEIVLPDVMGNFDLTVKANERLVWIYWPRVKELAKLGFVLHGSSWQDAERNLHSLLEAEWFSKVPVVYLPRMLSTAQDPFARIKLVQHVKFLFPDKEVHFLGGSPYCRNEIKLVQEELPDHVRSMDTSMPFIYGYEEVPLDMPHEPIHRQQDYFDLKFNDYQSVDAKENCQLLTAWAA